MEIKVVEVSFKDSTKGVTPHHGYYGKEPCVAKIVVSIDGVLYTSTTILAYEVARNVPYECIMGKLRDDVMGAIEQRLFGDYNRRI